mgnify:CR=1 FL=1
MGGGGGSKMAVTVYKYITRWSINVFTPDSEQNLISMTFITILPFSDRLLPRSLTS